MVTSFGEGLIQGFTLVDAMKARRRQAENDAERLSIARSAEVRAGEASDRAQTAFDRGIKEEGRLARDRETIIAGREAAERVRIAGPDANPEDIELVRTSSGLGDQFSTGVLTQRATTEDEQRATRNLPGIREAAGIGGGLQAGGAGEGGAAVDPAAAAADPGGAAAFTDVSGEEAPLPGDQFTNAGTRIVNMKDIRSFLPEEERNAIPKDVTSILGNFDTGTMTGLEEREVSAEVMTEDEINALPLNEISEATRRNQELLGVKAEEFVMIGRLREDLQASTESDWRAVLDVTKDSELRDLAGTDPTAYLSRYGEFRNSIQDDNTQALLDTRAREVSAASVNQLRELGEQQIPFLDNGLRDFNSEQGQIILAGMTENVRVMRAVNANFDVADEAEIRGGGMPIGQRELNGRVTAAMTERGMAPGPPTQHEDRVNNAQMQQLANSSTPRVRLTDANLDAISYMVQHGRLTIPEVAAFLETGSWSPAAQEIITARPDEDVIVFQNGRAVNIRPAYAQSLERVQAEAEAANATSERMNEEMLDFFLGTNPDDERRARQLMQSFRIDLHGQKDRISTQRGLDVDDLDTNELALFINQWAFEGTNFRNAYESEGWMHFVGLGPNFANEDTAPFSLEREQAMRDLGLNIRTLPRATIQTADEAEALRARLRESNDPGAQALSTASDPQIFALFP